MDTRSLENFLKAMGESLHHNRLDLHRDTRLNRLAILKDIERIGV
jgi:hypothetical protein